MDIFDQEQDNLLEGIHRMPSNYSRSRCIVESELAQMPAYILKGTLKYRRKTTVFA
jgi:hypothetical protein